MSSVFEVVVATIGGDRRTLARDAAVIQREVLSTFAATSDEKGAFGNANKASGAVGRNNLKGASGLDVGHLDCSDLEV